MKKKKQITEKSIGILKLYKIYTGYIIAGAMIDRY